MGPTFLPRLVNGPFDDPALFIPLRNEKRALLFDLGDITALASREVLKLSHIFVTHTHMDHFIGFDRLLRLLLGRDKDLYLYGPQGFLDNLAGKLAAYCWNLVGNYENRFTLHAVELHPDRALCCSYACHKRFAAEGVREIPFDGVVIDEASLCIRAIHLDHGIPVLAFRLDERFHINIVKTALEEMGLGPGPWLNRFKKMLYEGADLDETIEIPGTAPGDAPRRLSLGALKSRIVRISPGQRLAYVADAAGTPHNLEKIAAFCRDVDHLFVEAAFSNRHRDVALQKKHLTARQAGELARACQVKQYSIFHYSPRYSDCQELLEEEAARAFLNE
ncbi:MBL fold metallo-hydrolase [uncultured Desulfosarcina sp.]|uniref:ribonuclease Z n=1 Tax=uncultured Desulfosarcina sp. TaxID=218289 RepID=UPI0029C8C109|nr:MBL fold metallo-hydrolase [uncultured Desulfosarcina sp.]